MISKGDLPVFMTEESVRFAQGRVDLFIAPSKFAVLKMDAFGRFLSRARCIWLKSPLTSHLSPGGGFYKMSS